MIDITPRKYKNTHLNKNVQQFYKFLINFILSIMYTY